MNSGTVDPSLAIIIRAAVAATPPSLLDRLLVRTFI